MRAQSYRGRKVYPAETQTANRLPALQHLVVRI